MVVKGLKDGLTLSFIPFLVSLMIFQVKQVDIQMGTGLVTPKPRTEDQAMEHASSSWLKWQDSEMAKISKER